MSSAQGTRLRRADDETCWAAAQCIEPLLPIILRKGDSFQLGFSSRQLTVQGELNPHGSPKPSLLVGTDTGSNMGGGGGGEGGGEAKEGGGEEAVGRNAEGSGSGPTAAVKAAVTGQSDAERTVNEKGAAGGKGGEGEGEEACAKGEGTGSDENVDVGPLWASRDMGRASIGELSAAKGHVAAVRLAVSNAVEDGKQMREEAAARRGGEATVEDDAADGQLVRGSRCFYHQTDGTAQLATIVKVCLSAGNTMLAPYAQLLIRRHDSPAYTYV